jgi:hypothetical protein
MPSLKIDSEKATYWLYGFIFILFLSSLFMPFVFIFWLQDLLYHSNSHWTFIAPSSAYLSFFIGMLLIPIALTIHLIIRSKTNIRWIGWITGLLFVCSIPFFALGVSTYYYLDNDGIHMNELMSLEEIDYRWETMKELKEVWVLDNGVSRLDEYILITEDDSEVDLTASFKEHHVKMKTYQTLEEHGIKITSNHQDLWNNQ